MGRYSMLVSRYQVSEDPLLSERRVELLALALTAILLILLFFSVGRLVISPPPQPKLPSADSLLMTELRASNAVSADASNAAKARPVFWPSRRPVDAPQEAVVETKPEARKSELDKVKLLGIFGAGDSAGIIALVKGNKKRILQGDKVVGWTLDSIDGGQAVFMEDGQSKRLTLERGVVASAPNPPAAEAAGTTKKLEQNRQLTTGRSSNNNEEKK